MKKVLSIIFLFAIVFTACENENNYSAQIEKERKDIKQYIEDNGIKVHTCSKSDSVFSDGKTRNDICNSVTEDGVYYLLGEDSIYFRIIEVGVTTQPVERFNKVQIRYIETTLDGSRVENYWTTLDLPYPLEVIFGDIPASGSQTNANCKGWQSAIAMMKYSETIAELIVPSKLGIFKNYDSVTPCHYKFKFTL